MFRDSFPQKNQATQLFLLGKNESSSSLCTGPFFFSTLTWGNDPVWLILFKWLGFPPRDFCSHLSEKKQNCSLWASEGRRGVRKTPDGSSNASPSRNFLPRGARIQLGRHRLLLRGKGPWVHSVKSWPYMGVRAKIISISAARRVGSTTLLGFFEDF